MKELFTFHNFNNASLDALDPRVIRDLIEQTVLSYRDQDLWDDMVSIQETERSRIKTLAASV